MKKLYLLGTALLAGLTACNDNTNDLPDNGNQQNGDLPEWYYTGGQLGTAFLATSNRPSNSQLRLWNRQEWTASSKTVRLCLRNLS